MISFRSILVLVSWCSNLMLLSIFVGSSPVFAGVPQLRSLKASPLFERVLPLQQRSGSLSKTPDRSSLTPSAQVLYDYLAVQQHLPSHSRTPKNFYFHGWKWHTQSLIRQAMQLSRAAACWGAELWDLTALHTSVQHVVQLNLQGLHRIENRVFFPWVNERVGRDLPRETSKALGQVLKELESTQRTMQSLGKELISLSTPSPRTLNKRQKDVIWSKVATKSAELAKQAQSMLDTEQAVLIPLVALQVPAKEQHALNNAILRKLGLWDSRLHLVNMYQTIKDDPREYAQFQKTIPSVAQRMIPRWKRLLYDPAMSILDEMETK